MPVRILAGPLKGPTQKYTSWTSFTSFYQQILIFSILFPRVNIFCSWFNIFTINYHYRLFTVKSSYVLLRLGYVALKIFKISFLWTNEGVFAKKPGAFSIIFGNPPLIAAPCRSTVPTLCFARGNPAGLSRLADRQTITDWPAMTGNCYAFVRHPGSLFVLLRGSLRVIVVPLCVIVLLLLLSVLKIFFHFPIVTRSSPVRSARIIMRAKLEYAVIRPQVPYKSHRCTCARKSDSLLTARRPPLVHEWARYARINTRLAVPLFLRSSSSQPSLL